MNAKKATANAVYYPIVILCDLLQFDRSALGIANPPTKMEIAKQKRIRNQNNVISLLTKLLTLSHYWIKSTEWFIKKFLLVLLNYKL